MIPYPINRGSAQRTDQMILALVENNVDLTVIVSNLSERGISSKSIEDRLSKVYKNVKFIVRRHPSLLDKSKKTDEVKQYKVYLLTLLLDFMTFSKYKAHNFRLMSLNIRKTLKKELNKSKYDAVYCNYLYNVPNFLTRYNVEIISDIHDLQYRRIENDIIPNSSFFSSFLYKIFFKRSELNRLKKVDKIISISPVETELLKKILPQKNIYTIPATADKPSKKYTTSYKFDIAFIGSNSDANRDSLLWFLNECFDDIVNKKRQVKFLIQGRITRNKLIKENKVLLKYLGKNIILSDFVENLSDIYSDTKIIVCPVIKGSGMKIKVIEALSYGKAIVGTSIAFEGIKVNNNEHAFIENNSKEFVLKILELLNNSQKRKEFEENSLLFFEDNHSFEKCTAYMKGIL